MSNLNIIELIQAVTLGRNGKEATLLAGGPVQRLLRQNKSLVTWQSVNALGRV